MTRGMLASVLYRAAGYLFRETLTLPADVAADSYCALAAAWAVGDGIVNGYGDGRFGPDDPLTREQLAVILYRYAGGAPASRAAGAAILRRFMETVMDPAATGAR